MRSTIFITTQETKMTTELTIPLDTTHIWKNNQMLSEKTPAEELDEDNQKILHKIVGKFLYYDIAIDPTMLMTLNSLAAL